MAENKVFISLGGGCDIASNLKRLKISNSTLFFDYLWNLDDGLKSVVKILDENFSSFTQKEYFIRTYHERFNKEVFVNVHFPNIAFIHYDMASSKAFSSFVRKINRMRKLLSSDKEIVFLYYRLHSEPINSNYKANIHDKMLFFLEESKYFVNYLNNSQPNLLFNLHCIFLKPLDNESQTSQEIDSFFAKRINDRERLGDKIKFSTGYERNDESQEKNKVSLDRWNEILLTPKKEMPPKLRQKIYKALIGNKFYKKQSWYEILNKKVKKSS
jgi:hypothetical protein